MSKCRNANGDLVNHCGDRGIYSNTATYDDCVALCNTHAASCQGMLYNPDWKKCYIVVPVSYSSTMEAAGQWCQNNDNGDGAISVSKTSTYSGGWPCYVKDQARQDIANHKYVRQAKGGSNEWGGDAKQI